MKLVTAIYYESYILLFYDNNEIYKFDPRSNTFSIMSYGPQKASTHQS